LARSAVGVGRVAGEREDGQALEDVEVRVRAHDVEEPGHDVHLDAEVAQAPQHGQGALVRVAGERDDDPLRAVLADEGGQVDEVAQDRDVGHVGRGCEGVAVHEPDEAQAVLGVRAQLAGHELTDLAGADDERVLDVLRAPAGDRARALRAVGRQTAAANQPSAAAGTTDSPDPVACATRTTAKAT
jgi:hypothetical protein